MRLHGWASLAFFGLTGTLLAQQTVSPPQLLRVPSTPPANTSDARLAESVPLPLRTPESEPRLNLEDELTQLRSELKLLDAAREDVSRGTKMVDTESDRVVVQQRQELLDLLTKIATKGVTRRATPSGTTPPKTAPAVDPVTEPLEPKAVPVIVPAVIPPAPHAFPIPDDAVDPFALGKVLFRSGDYVAAEKAFAKVQPTDENRMMLKYLTATCLRKRSQWKPASEAFRVVAGSDQDPVLRDLAKWQLENLTWHQQTESQLGQMKAERDKRSSTGKSRSAAADEIKP